MQGTIEWKTPRIGSEFYNALDPRLKGLIHTLADWQAGRLDLPLVITCIIRDPIENAQVNGRPQSAHIMVPGQTYARAIDIRNHDLTEKQQEDRRAFIQIWNRGLPSPMFHVIDHNSGHGNHTHININQLYKI